MRRRTTSVLVAASLVLLIADSGNAATRPLPLKLLAGSAREIYVDRNGVYVTFPVQLPAGLRARDISATVVSATLGKRSELRLRNAFSARIQPPLRAQTALLAISVDLNPALKPGTYQLTIVASSGRTAQQRRTTRKSIKIVVPPATLREPKTLVVERTLPFLGLGGNDEMPRFRLRETSTRSRLTRIDIEQSTDARDGNKASASRLVFTYPKAIEPGGKGDATYTFEGGAFKHVGTFTGSADIDAAELTAPVSFDFEVRVRRTTWLIIFLAGAGVVLGFFVRRLLQRFIDVSRAQEAASDLALQIENATEDGDATLRRKLAEAEDALGPAFGWLKSATDVETAVKAAANEYKVAVADFSNRTRAAVDQQSRLSSIVDRDWALPEGLEEVLTQTRAQLANAKRQVDANQIDKASETQKAAETKLEQEAVRSCRTWISEAEQFLDSVETSPPPPALLPDKRTKVEERVRAAIAEPSNDSKNELTQVLSRLDGAVRSVDTMRRLLLTITEAEVHAVQQRVPSTDAGRAESLFNDFANAVDDTNVNPAELTKHYRVFIEGLEELVLKNGGDRARVQEGKYAEAIQPPKPLQTQLGGKGTVVLPSTAPLFAADDIAGHVIPAASPISRVLPALPPAQVLRRRASLTLVTAFGLQWLLTSVILVGLAYVLFADNWQGTWQDVAEVFLWAFALDVSANTVLNLAKGGLKTTPAAAGS